MMFHLNLIYHKINLFFLIAITFAMFLLVKRVKR